MKSLWSDIHHEWGTDQQGNLRVVTDVGAIYTSIDNILGTSPGERVMLPEFASRIRSMLFQPLDDVLGKVLSDEVKRTIETWDDRVSVSQVQFIIDADRSQMTLSVEFTVRGYTETLQYSKRFKA